MTLETIATGAQILLVFILLPYVFWLSKIVKDTKTSTDIIKNVQEYFEKVHEAARTLNDPEEVKKVVDIKVEKAMYAFEKEYQAKVEEEKLEYEKQNQDNKKELREVLKAKRVDIEQLDKNSQRLQAQYDKYVETLVGNYKKLIRMFIRYYILSLPTVDQKLLSEYLDKHSEEAFTKELVSIRKEYLSDQKATNAFANYIATARIKVQPGRDLLSSSEREGNALENALTMSVTGKPESDDS